MNRFLWCFIALTPLGGLAGAQSFGVSARGAVGGLTIPNAYVLPEGTIAVSANNFQEPGLGRFGRPRNFSLGVGLLPSLELFGRFADYQNPQLGTNFGLNPRDISANFKLELPIRRQYLPRVAVGMTDVSGGVSYFKSAYAVASDEIDWLRWTVGYAKGADAVGNPAIGKTFDGPFGGVELALGESGASLLAEYDGKEKHIGARYMSPAISRMADAQVVASLLRSSGARDAAGREMDRTSAAVSVLIPLESLAQKPATFKPSHMLASLDARPPGGGMMPTSEDRQESLLKALIASGLERVRVGIRANSLIVEYENNRYGQNESDAIGVVLGLAAEYAPAGVRRVSAITLKSGQRMYETSVDVGIFRAYLRDGDVAQARTSLAVDRAPSYGTGVKWVNSEPARRSPLRVEIKPDFAFQLGTEVGLFDRTLAANIQTFVPLWQGAEFYTSYVEHISNTRNYDVGNVFGAVRQRTGLKVASVQQSFWLTEHVHANLGVGRYNYEAFGMQGEATVFMPGRDDVIRLRGGVYERQPGQSRKQAMPASLSYRYVHSPSTWVEFGAQQYSDGTRGPAVVFTRWFGDVSVNLFYRKGGVAQYVGLELSIPLTPRRGIDIGWLQLAGTPQFSQHVRTRLVDSNAPINYVNPSGARDMQLDYNAELHHLNAGRTSQSYYISQLPRMREAFYLYACEYLPQ